MPSDPHLHDPRPHDQCRLEVTGTLTLEPVALPLASSTAKSGGNAAPIRIDLSTAADDVLTIDFTRLPPAVGIRSLARQLWKSRNGMATWLAAVGQPIQVRVAGQTWLSIDIAPSRLGKLLKMPGLTLRFAGTNILKERLRRR